MHYGQLDYGNGPRAAPTVFDGLVYTLGATGKLNCLDLKTGSVRWSANLVSDFDGRMPTWGYAASPLIFRDTVIVHPGSAKGASVVALNRRTGKKVWASLSDEAHVRDADPDRAGRPRATGLLDAVTHSRSRRSQRRPALGTSLRSHLWRLDRYARLPCEPCLCERLLGRCQGHPFGRERSQRELWPGKTSARSAD